MTDNAGADAYIVFSVAGTLYALRSAEVQQPSVREAASAALHQALEAGYQLQLTKPVDPAVVADSIKALVTAARLSFRGSARLDSRFGGAASAPDGSSPRT